MNDEVAEWLRRWTANPLGSARVGSNPIFVDDILIWKQWEILLLAANVGIKTFQKNDYQEQWTFGEQLALIES